MQETQETWVRSLGQEDPLEKEMATCSSILAWEIPWTGEPGGLQSMQPQNVGHGLTTKQHTGLGWPPIPMTVSSEEEARTQRHTGDVTM